MKPSGPSFFYLGSPNQPSSTPLPVSPLTSTSTSFRRRPHQLSLPRSGNRTRLVTSPKSLDSATFTLASLQLSRDLEPGAAFLHHTSRHGYHHGSSGKIDGHSRGGSRLTNSRRRALSYSPSRRHRRSSSSRSRSPNEVTFRTSYPSSILQTIIQQGRLQQQQQQQEQEQQEQQHDNVQISWYEDTDSPAEEDDIGMDLEEYHRQRKALEQRMLDRGEAAERSRSSFLRARRHSAAYVVQHAKTVVQQQRTELEVKRRRLEDEMDRKMVLAFARKKAHLQASRENDPSRRHHRRKRDLHAPSGPAPSSSSPSSSSSAGAGVVSSSSSSASLVLEKRTSTTTTTRTTTRTTTTIVSSPKNRGESFQQNKVIAVRGGREDKRKKEEEQDDEKEEVAMRKGMTRLLGHTSSTSLDSPRSSNSRQRNTEMGIVADHPPPPSLHGSVTREQQHNMTPTTTTPTTTTTTALFNTLRTTNNNNPLTTNSLRDVRGTTDTAAPPRLVRKQATHTAVSQPLPSSTVTPGMNNVDPRLEWATLSVQRHRLQNATTKTMRLFQRAIGGRSQGSSSPKDLLTLGYDALVQRMVSKDLLMAATRLLELAGALTRIDARLQQRRPCPRRVLRNPARMFLSAFLVVAHPAYLHTPLVATHPSQEDTNSNSNTDDGFQALVDSAKQLLDALETWFRASLPSSQAPAIDPSPSETTTTTTSAAAQGVVVQQFDQAWSVYYDRMMTWKAQDQARLVDSLVAHAQQIEALWQTVQQQQQQHQQGGLVATASAGTEAEWRPRIEAQRRDLKAKARQIGGPAAEARVAAVWGETLGGGEGSSGLGPPQQQQHPSPVNATVVTAQEDEEEEGGAPLPPSSETTITDISRATSAANTPPAPPSLPTFVAEPASAPSPMDMEDVVAGVQPVEVAAAASTMAGSKRQRQDSTSRAMSVDPPSPPTRHEQQEQGQEPLKEEKRVVQEQEEEKQTKIRASESGNEGDQKAAATDVPPLAPKAGGSSTKEAPASTSSSSTKGTATKDPNAKAKHVIDKSKQADDMIGKRMPARMSLEEIDMFLTSFDKPYQMSNLQFLHEMALNPDFQIDAQITTEARTAQRQERRRIKLQGLTAGVAAATGGSSSSSSSSSSSLGQEEREAQFLQQHDQQQQQDAAAELMRATKALTLDYGPEGVGLKAAAHEQFQAQVHEMAITAVFSAIERDAQQDALGVWMPTLLSAIRERLLELMPYKTVPHKLVLKELDPEWLQQQADRNVLETDRLMLLIVEMMQKMCAPVRDDEIKAIRESLMKAQTLGAGEAVAAPAGPSTAAQEEGEGSTASAASASESPSASTSPSALKKTRTRILVDCLRNIFEVLDEMLLDMTRFRISALRPYLRKQAIPYESAKFKAALVAREKSLVITKHWLAHAASQVGATSAPTAATATSATTTATNSETAQDSTKEQQGSTSNASGSASNKGMKGSAQYYRIFTQGYMNVLFSKVPLYEGLSLPETFDLDAMRIESLQNQLRGISFVAALMQVARLKTHRLGSWTGADVGQVGQQLKEKLFQLIRSQTTTLEQLQDAVVEAVEMEAHHHYRYQMEQRQQQRSPSPLRSPSTPSPPPPPPQPLSPEDRQVIGNMVSKALSFEGSYIYDAIVKKLRGLMQNYLEALHASVGSGHSDQMGAQGGSDMDMLGGEEVAGPFATTTIVTEQGGKPKVVLKDPRQLQQLGLGDVAYELLPVIRDIRLLAQYNTEAYKDWYDDILKALVSAVPAAPSSSSSSSSSAAAAAPLAQNQQAVAPSQAQPPSEPQPPVLNDPMEIEPPEAEAAEAPPPPLPTTTTATTVAAATVAAAAPPTSDQPKAPPKPQRPKKKKAPATTATTTTAKASDKTTETGQLPLESSEQAPVGGGAVDEAAKPAPKPARKRSTSAKKKKKEEEEEEAVGGKEVDVDATKAVVAEMEASEKVEGEEAEEKNTTTTTTTKKKRATSTPKQQGRKKKEEGQPQDDEDDHTAGPSVTAPAPAPARPRPRSKSQSTKPRPRPRPLAPAPAPPAPALVLVPRMEPTQQIQPMVMPAATLESTEALPMLPMSLDTTSVTTTVAQADAVPQGIIEPPQTTMVITTTTPSTQVAEKAGGELAADAPAVVQLAPRQQESVVINAMPDQFPSSSSLPPPPPPEAASSSPPPPSST
ncbi:T-complex protein 11 [Actinomortierella ambigua]|uniref:T-complex protein 11 n=1 Tax=Actinomortierella ambigua TaxID=1343610 RepID=A0A9P6QEX3_9FUNG|nr:T-complex protein 11 [Actinomortierella ambigua]